MNDKNTRLLQVLIDPDTMNELVELCKADERSWSAEVRFLIHRALEQKRVLLQPQPTNGGSDASS